MTDKITLTNLVNLQNETTAVSAINANNAVLTTALDNTLSRDGTTPNTMGAILDMNSNAIINLPAPVSISSPLRLVDVAGNPTITVPPVGTSGAKVPLLNGNNTWSGTNAFTAATTFTSSTFSSTVGITGNTTVGGTLGVTGNITAPNLLGVSGNLGITAATGGNVVLTITGGASNLVFAGTNMYPGTDDTLILGLSPSNRYKQLLLGATASTSTTTGALIIGGGAGIGGALWLGGQALINGAASSFSEQLSVTSSSEVAHFYRTTTTNAFAIASFESNVGGTRSRNLTISADGGIAAKAAILSSGATSGVGYSTGAGGTVTQLTNKTTAVTLNTISGQITLNNASLVNNGLAQFTFTNSNIAATDMLLVSLQTPVTSNAYRVWVNSTSAGSATIVLTQTSGSTLSDAVVLNFIVIKGVTS